jgi:hypothetical protein
VPAVRLKQFLHGITEQAKAGYSPRGG